jgi:hypothetical protein
MIPPRAEYERFIYNIARDFQIVEKSSLHFFSTSAAAGMLKGIVWFRNGLTLKVVEVIDFAVGEILDYSYTVYDGKEKIAWYDPQPHPESPELSETFPHHIHLPPDIKKNRKPAKGINFHHNNLPTLFEAIEILKP